MIELIIEGLIADLSEDIAADITYSLADIRTPEKRQVNYTRTITLNGTVQNNYIFGNIHNIDVSNEVDVAARNVGVNYNPKKLAKAQLIFDGVQIFDGALRLWKVETKGTLISYEVSLFGKLFDIFNVIGDAKLTDLDFSEFNHALTWANVKATWLSTYTGAFRYPLIDYGFNVQDVSGRPASFKFGSLVPCLHYKTYIDKIFSSIGASYDLNFSDLSIYNKLLVTPSTPQVLGTPKYLDGTRNAFVYYNGPDGPGAPRTINAAAINVENINTIGNFNTDKTIFTFDNNYSTTFQYKVYVSLTVKNTAFYTGGFPSSIVLRCEVGYTSGGGASSEVVFQEQLFTSPGQAKAFTLEVPRRAYQNGDTVRFYIKNVPYYINAIVEPGSQIKAISPTDTSTDYVLNEGDIYAMYQSVPKEVKQVDFLKDFIKFFNLYVTQDPNDPSITVFTPRTDFYKKVKLAAKDWTNKVDYDQPVTITPISQLTAKQYVFTWKQDKDFWCEQYFNTVKEVYGQVTFISDTDVVTNTETVTLLFSPAVMQRYANSSVICPAIYKVESGVRKTDKFNSRLLIWGGKFVAGHNIDLLNVDGTVEETITEYPFAGHIDHPTAPTFDLNFGLTNSDLPIAPVNQFSKYWEQALRDASDKDGKLIACTMLLKPEDIEALDFAALFKIGDHYFRLNKIDGYDPFKLGTCKVELIKVVNM